MFSNYCIEIIFLRRHLSSNDLILEDFDFWVDLEIELIPILLMELLNRVVFQNFNCFFCVAVLRKDMLEQNLFNDSHKSAVVKVELAWVDGRKLVLDW